MPKPRKRGPPPRKPIQAPRLAPLTRVEATTVHPPFLGPVAEPPPSVTTPTHYTSPDPMPFRKDPLPLGFSGRNYHALSGWYASPPEKVKAPPRKPKGWRLPRKGSKARERYERALTATTQSRAKAGVALVRTARMVAGEKRGDHYASEVSPLRAKRIVSRKRPVKPVWRSVGSEGTG